MSWAGRNLPELRCVRLGGSSTLLPSMRPLRLRLGSSWTNQNQTPQDWRPSRNPLQTVCALTWTASSPPVRPPLPSPSLGHRRVCAEGSVPSPQVTRVGGGLGMDRKMAMSSEAWRTQGSESVRPSSGLQCAGRQALGPGYLTEDRHSRFPASGSLPSCGDARPLRTLLCP